MNWAPVVAAGHNIWQWGMASSTSLYAYSAALPLECRANLIYAFGVCSGAPSLIFPTPGFAPFSLCWGWFLVGILMGMLIIIIILFVLGYFKAHPSTSIFSLLQVASETTTNPEKRRLYAYLLNERDEGLIRLASSFNITPEQLIIQLMREQTENVGAPVTRPRPTTAANR